MQCRVHASIDQLARLSCLSLFLLDFDCMKMNSSAPTIENYLLFCFEKPKTTS
nr:MAG TPA: hypothetical protein [Caudoviricetes sp.]